MSRRFHTPEMGQVGHTRWFEDDELPALDWSQVTAIETSENMTVEQFKNRWKKFPEVRLPEPKSLPYSCRVQSGLISHQQERKSND